MITPPAFANIGYQTYIIFAVINAAIVPSVYFFFPETAYRSLEEMDEIFHNTTNAFTANAFPDVRLSNNGGLLLGPLIINESYALISLTVPVRDNRNTNFTLGYMTLVASAASVIEIQNSREGLGDTGVCLMVGPTTQSNRFAGSANASNVTPQPWDIPNFGDEWSMFKKEYPLPGQFGVGLTFGEYILGSRQWPDVDFNQVSFDPDKFADDLLEDNMPDKQAHPEEKKGSFNDKQQGQEVAPPPPPVPVPAPAMQAGKDKSKKPKPPTKETLERWTNCQSLREKE